MSERTTPVPQQPFRPGSPITAQRLNRLESMVQRAMNITVEGMDMVNGPSGVAFRKRPTPAVDGDSLQLVKITVTLDGFGDYTGRLVTSIQKQGPPLDDIVNVGDADVTVRPVRLDASTPLQVGDIWPVVWKEGETYYVQPPIFWGAAS